MGIGITALAVGGAAMIGGLVWQFALNNPAPSSAGAPKGPAPKAARPKAVVVSPVVGPGQAGITVGGAF